MTEWLKKDTLPPFRILIDSAYLVSLVYSVYLVFLDSLSFLTKRTIKTKETQRTKLGYFFYLPLGDLDSYPHPDQTQENSDSSTVGHLLLKNPSQVFKRP